MKKRWLVWILLLTIAAVFAGCGKKSGTVKKTTEEKTAEQAGEKSFTAGYIYSPDEQAERLEEYRVKLEGINEKTLLSALKEKGVLNKDIKILSYEKKDQMIIIDFNEAFGSYFRVMGTAEESLKMEAVAKTFCKNLGASKFSFTVEGEILETGHQIYDQIIGVK